MNVTSLPEGARETPARDPGGAPRGGPTGLSTLAGDSASMFGSRVVRLVLSFASVMLTTRLLHPKGYGLLTYFTVVGMLIFTVSSNWTSTAVSRYGREEFERCGSLVATSWNRALIVLPFYLLAAVLLPVLKLAGAFPAEFGWTYVWLAVAYGGVLILAEHIRYLLEASGRMKASALGFAAEQMVFVVGVALLLSLGVSHSPLPVVAISVAGGALVTSAFAILIWRIALWPPTIDRPVLVRILRFSAPMIGFVLSQYVIQAVDLVVIRALEDRTQVGIYAFAYQAYSALQVLAVVAPQLLVPLFVSLREGRQEDRVRLYFDRVIPLATLLTAAAVGMAGPWLWLVIPLVVGHAFAASALPLAVLLISLVLLILDNLLAPIVVLHERTRSIALLNIAAAAVNVIGDVILLAPLHTGIVGAAAATTAGFAVIAGGYFVIARRCVSGSARFPVRYLTPVLAGLLPGLALGASAAPLGFPLALATTLAIVILGRPFSARDRELLSTLRIPALLRRPLLGFVSLGIGLPAGERPDPA